MQLSTLCQDSIHSVLTSCSKNDEDDEEYIYEDFKAVSHSCYGLGNVLMP